MNKNIPSQPAPSDWETCLRVLQTVSEDVALAENDERFKALVAKIHKNGRRYAHSRAEQKQIDLDRERRATTTMVQIQKAQAQPVARTARGIMYESNTYYQLMNSNWVPSEEFPEILSVPVHCYICKAPYKPLHFFYHQLCPNCARANFAKRTQTADLNGYTALVTGARVKIGYQTALRLLRDGATVVATTRFPQDAARRYAAEPDFEQWSHRLHIYAIDLRGISDVERFADYLLATLPHLDILVNNAAQTVKRPLAWYRSLLQGEQEPMANLPESLQSLLPISPAYASSPLLEAHPDYPETSDLAQLESYFPADIFDGDGQAIDTRPENSWTLKLGEISTLEMAEVFLINTMAPFILAGRLKPLMLRSPHRQRFIVNVSAMEGQFTRVAKTAAHPHMNMSKAALNMLTRTSAQDYAKDRIFMCSVDTGWITDDMPQPSRERVRPEQDFYPPLDIIDGMARVYDPIAYGIQHSPYYGVFLKDYKEYPW